MTPAVRAEPRAGTLIVRDGRVVYASEGVALLLGRRVEDVVGRPYGEFLVPEQRATVADRNERRARGERVPQRYEVTAALPEGGRRLVELHVEEDGGDFLVHVRDLSGQQARRLRLDSVATLGAALQHERSEQAIHALVQRELRDLGLASAIVTGGPDGVRVVFGSVSPEFAARFLAEMGTPLEGYAARWNPLFERLWRDGATFSEDFALEVSASVPEEHAAAYRQLVSAAGLGRGAAVRVADGEPPSFLVVAGDWLRPEDLPAVRLFGAQLAAALAAARTISDLSRRNADLAAVNRVAELAGAATDLSVFFARAAEVLRDTLGSRGTAVYVLDEAANQLGPAYADGAPPSVIARYERLPLDDRRGAAMRQRISQVLEAPAGSPYSDLGFRTLARIPLVARSRPVGVLGVGFDAPAEWVRARMDLLTAIAAHYASTLESQGLLARLRRRVSDLEAVHALTERVFANAPGDVPGLLRDACREAARALSCRGACLFLVEDGATLRAAAAWGIDVDLDRLHLGVEEDGLAVEAIRERAPVWSADVTKDPRSAMCGRPHIPPLAMLAVPLTARDATRGVLYLADDAGRAFSDAEFALANALGGELAVGVENAELYADLRRRVEELSLVNEMARTVAASLDLDAVLRDGVEAARRLLDASRAFVGLYDPVRSELRFGAWVGFEDPLPPPSIPLSDAALLADVIRERRPFVLEDAAEDPRLYEGYRRRYAPRAVLAAPLLLRGEPVGVLLVDEARGPRRFTPSDVERVTAVGSHLAVAIENARLYAEARGRLSELSTVLDVARVVSSSLDLEEVLGAGAEHLKRTLEASACTILLDDPRTQELRRAASRGEPIGAQRVALDVPSLAREALDARAPVKGPPGAVGGAPGEVVLAVPLHVRDLPVGVALVGGGAPDREFAPGDLARATAIASQLAVAVDNARLYSETRRRAEQVGLLHEVGRSLVATLDIRRVLERGVENLARIVDAPCASLALANAEGTHVEICAVSGPHASHLGMRLPLDPVEASLAARVFRLREPVLVEDGAEDDRVNEGLRSDTGARGYLGLPLLVRERTIGVAVIMDPRGPRRFTPAEVERAAAIANQLAVAVENARLYEDLRKSYAELARAQEQLLEGERLAALGELSAIVAHEVRNPLGVIFNSLGSLRRLLRPAGDAKMLLDIVGEEADRLNRIVGDLLDFARPSTPQLSPERLDRVVDDAVAAALAQNPSAIEVVRQTDGSVPAVPMDARLVRQAVLNVAVNAVQAMPRGGRITVRTRRDGETAVLDVEDTGPGIPDEVKERIFEPFFTTKASGTGLGLAVVRRIVEGHGGAVTVHSAGGSGTVFTLRFPLAATGDVENSPAMG